MQLEPNKIKSVIIKKVKVERRIYAILDGLDI